MSVIQWIDKLAVRLTEKAANFIELVVAAARQFEIRRKHERALKRLTALKRPLPSEFRFDRQEANRR